MGLLRPDPPTRGRDREVVRVRRRLAQLAGQLDAQPRAEPVTEPEPTPPSGRHRAPALPGPARAAGAVADRGVTGQHVAVVGLLVAALVTGAAWWVLDARPQTRVATPQPLSPPASPVGTPPAGTATGPSIGPAPTAPGEPAEATVVVDVTGRVRSPGLVTLPAGSRVADALESAGGVRPRVDLSTLNLARLVVDGEQILVGVQAAPWPSGDPPATSTVPGVPVAPVDLNTATMVELETLPGVGPVTAQSILDWRVANGGFTTVDELLEVDGIGEVTLADLRDLVTV